MISTANKRMFTMHIADSDAFLDMPLSAQALYFHLNMRADDDGFLGNSKRIQRMVGASDDDLKLLIGKKFLLAFENGVIAIKHWRMNNTIQSDRYTPTVYQEEMSMLVLKENKSYTFNDDFSMETKCIQNVSTNIDKDRGIDLGLDSDKDSVMTVSKDTVCQTGESVQRIIEHWNTLGFNRVAKITKSSNRYKMLIARLREYSEEDVLVAIDNIKYSSFLRGNNDKGWSIDFEWFVKPNNFIKVFEDKYRDRFPKKEYHKSNTQQQRQ